MGRRAAWVLLAAVLALPLIAGCGRERPDQAELAPTTTLSEEEATEGFGEEEIALSGKIRIDGSSTLQPFATGAAERFRRSEPDVRITVGASGTGGGFEKFCAGEIEITDASRPIEDEEQAACAKERIDFVELHVANDGIAVIGSRENTWADCLSLEQLRLIWNRGSKADSWSDVDPGFPDERLRLAGPGTDSGTFDFFTETVNGEDGVSRSDYSLSENDNVIVEAVGGTAGGLGYLGLSYALENADRVTTLAVRDEDACVEPSDETVQDDSYPLSRPLFMYVREDALEKVEVDAFLAFVISNQAAIAQQARFVPLTDDQAARAQTVLEGAGLDVEDE